MGLSKSVQQQSGVVTSYTRVMRVQVVVEDYLDKESRDVGCQPIDTRKIRFMIPVMDEEGIEIGERIDPAVAQFIYNQLKLLPQFEGAVDVLEEES